jgi:hypothetical protein
MLFDKFVKETYSWWTSYLELIVKAHEEGTLDSGTGILLFPNILLVTKCDGYFVAELIGASKTFNGLRIKKHREPSIYRYFSQFDASEPDPCMHLDGGHHGFRFICLAQEAEFEAVKSRFPQIELYGSKLNRVGGHGSVFSFGDNFSSCAIENCVLVNKREHVYRCKNILSAYVVKSGISKMELVGLFEWTTADGQVKGVHTVADNEDKLVVSGQLQSMYLFPSLRETTIGKFINLHPEIIKKAFKTDHFEYEPYLEWLEHDGTCEDRAINPDLMVKRQDGFFDIYDLKTALLNKSNVTKGGRKRRRFIDSIEEGVAQLANYREYFSYQKNAEHAKEKYGIIIKEPNLVLVVGSYENSYIDEVNQACRRYEGIDIIDYDTFCHLFI